MKYRYAIVRTPGPDVHQGLTTARMGAVRQDRFLENHEKYIRALQSFGLEVIRLDPLPGFPDACFVEDTAIITPEIAVITNPGAETRKGEAGAMAPVVSRYRTTVAVQPPGILDGGDVLIAGRHVFTGISHRTDEAGVRQLEEALKPFGYECIRVPVSGGLHLKSGVNAAGPQTLVLTPPYAELDIFSAFEKIVIPAEEAYAANFLCINERLLIPAGFPRTRERLRPIGLEMIEIDTREFQKLDGGLTCLSLRF